MPAIVPISSLGPESIPTAESSIHAVVSLVWPYSATNHQYALLLADQDPNLRLNRGQVRVRFTGAAADAAKNIGIADVLHLRLQGARWIEQDANIRTPGKSVDGELVYSTFLDVSIRRTGREPLRLTVDTRSQHDEAPTELLRTPVSSKISPSKQLDTNVYFGSSRFSNDYVSARVEADPFVDDAVAHEGSQRGVKRQRTQYVRHVKATDEPRTTLIQDAGESKAADKPGSRPISTVGTEDDDHVSGQESAESDGSNSRPTRDKHDSTMDQTIRSLFGFKDVVATAESTEPSHSETMSRVEPVSRISDFELAFASATYTEEDDLYSISDRAASRSASVEHEVQFTGDDQPHATESAPLSKELPKAETVSDSTLQPDAGAVRQIRFDERDQLEMNAASVSARLTDHHYDSKFGEQRIHPNVSIVTGSTSALPLSAQIEPIMAESGEEITRATSQDTRMDLEGPTETTASDQQADDTSVSSSLLSDPPDTVHEPLSTTSRSRDQALATPLPPSLKSNQSPSGSSIRAFFEQRSGDSGPSSASQSKRYSFLQKDSPSVRPSKNHTSNSRPSSILSRLRFSTGISESVLEENEPIARANNAGQVTRAIADKTESEMQAVNRGIRTDDAYFTKLNSLSRYLNPTGYATCGKDCVDVIAVVTAATKEPSRAKSGPRDYFITFSITDESMLSLQQTAVDILRPYKAFLPVAEIGDVVLLRAFTVKSRNHSPCLMSTDASAWCVWRYSQQGTTGLVDAVQEHISGPIVEFHDQERQYVRSLRSWWLFKRQAIQAIPPGTEHSLVNKSAAGSTVA